MTHAAPQPDSRPGTGRRIGGLALDWALCLVLSSVFFPAASVEGVTPLPAILNGKPFATLAIWAVQHLILVATVGATIGHRVFGLRVVRADGGTYVGFAKAAIRTLLIVLVIPAVVWDSDGRGLHDRAAGTWLIRSGNRP